MSKIHLWVSSVVSVLVAAVGWVSIFFDDYGRATICLVLAFWILGELRRDVDLSLSQSHKDLGDAYLRLAKAIAEKAEGKSQS